VRAVEKELGNLKNLEAGVLIDLLLSYRAVSGWADMITLVKKMPRPVAATVMVQEQLAFALNRAGQGDDAEKVLTELWPGEDPAARLWEYSVASIKTAGKQR
jgi:hypothetical protein